jgi:cell division protein FtsB
MRATLEAPPNTPDPMLPGMGLLLVNKDLRRAEETHDEEFRRDAPPRPARTRGRIRRVLTSRALAWAVTLLVAASAIGAGFVVVSNARQDHDQLTQQLATLQAGSEGSQASLASAMARNEDLRARIAKLQGQIVDLQGQKVQTVVETKTVTVTNTVTEYVPNGEEITVEITGFEGLVRVYDVHLTHSYGYSDLIGIAENTSGDAISYAQLSCSFHDKDGKLLATSIDNKQNWQPGQSWGFVCSADVDATGGILRVDEMS